MRNLSSWRKASHDTNQVLWCTSGRRSETSPTSSAYFAVVAAGQPREDTLSGASLRRIHRPSSMLTDKRQQCLNFKRPRPMIDFGLTRGSGCQFRKLMEIQYVGEMRRRRIANPIELTEQRRNACFTAPTPPGRPMSGPLETVNPLLQVGDQGMMMFR